VECVGTLDPKGSRYRGSLLRLDARNKTWVTWQWLPAVREPRKREALPSRA